MIRRLISTRRLIPLDRLEEYTAGWERVRNAVLAAGGRAWLFRGSRHQDQFLECIEWTDHGSSATFTDGAAIAAARRDMAERFGEGHTDDWEEETFGSSRDSGSDAERPRDAT